MRTLLALLTAAAFLSVGGCESSAPTPSAAAIIDSARAAHGSSVLNNAVVTFTLRDDAYRVRQNHGRFHYRRSYIDSLGRSVTEGFTNDSLYRVVEKDTVSLSASQRDGIRTTVNSVTYFALLPGPLGDAAVQPSYSGRDSIGGVPYHRIQVTFEQEGGGEDWQDVFMYWFRTDTYDMDYLAYAYGQGPEEESGTRFRVAYNPRNVNGVRFSDYYNYTVDSLSADQVAQYPYLWAQEAARLVSRIELDSVRVRPLTNTDRSNTER